METAETHAAPKPPCLNCGKKMPRKATFCPHCGQRNNQGKVTMRELLQRFWNNFSHLDSKFVKMCWQLFVPGKVTREYFAGRQKRYPHPVQFFFVVMFFFLLGSHKSCENQARLRMTDNDGGFAIASDDRPAQGEQWMGSDQFFQALQRYALGRALRAAHDSLPPTLRTPATRQALDSALQRVNGPWERSFLAIQSERDSSGQPLPIDSIPLNFINYSVTVATADLAQLNPDQIIQKYQFADWRDRILLKQGLKSIKDPNGLMRQYVGSFAWTTLLLIALMALLLKALYRRHYYVEHFVFLLHQNASVFLLIAALLLFQTYIAELPEAINLLLFIWIGLSLLLAMRRFYRQPWLQTTLKWLIYCFIYVISFSTLFVASLLLVFLIF